MSIQQNRAMYRRYLDRCNAHDFGSLGEFVAENVRVNGQAQGLDVPLQTLADVVTAFPDYHWGLNQLLAEGEWLSARFTDSGTHHGSFLGFAPTGRSVTALEFATYHLSMARSPRCGSPLTTWRFFVSSPVMTNRVIREHICSLVPSGSGEMSSHPGPAEDTAQARRSV